MATSRVPAVIDYLVSACQASALLGAAASPVSVYDGPATTSEDTKLILWIGLDDPDTANAPRAGSGTQTWAGLGHQARNEQLTVYCCAEAWSGEDDVRTVRQAAYAITAAVEDLVRNDATLGGTVTVPGNAAVTAMDLLQNNTVRGAVARVMFEITAQARIGG